MEVLQYLEMQKISSALICDVEKFRMKHSVDENTISAPAVFTHSAIAGPGIPSRSPIIIAFFPSKIAIIISPFFLFLTFYRSFLYDLEITVLSRYIS